MTLVFSAKENASLHTHVLGVNYPKKKWIWKIIMLFMGKNHELSITVSHYLRVSKKNPHDLLLDGCFSGFHIGQPVKCPATSPTHVFRTSNGGQGDPQVLATAMEAMMVLYLGKIKGNS